MASRRKVKTWTKTTRKVLRMLQVTKVKVKIKSLNRKWMTMMAMRLQTRQITTLISLTSNQILQRRMTIRSFWNKMVRSNLIRLMELTEELTLKQD